MTRKRAPKTKAPSRPQSATYLYGLLRSPRVPRVDDGPRGLPGLGPLRPLPAGDGLWLVAADAPLPRYGAAALHRGLKDLDWVAGCAVAHESVVEHFAARHTVLPMRLFTLFTSDRRALAHVEKDRVRVESTLEKVAGRKEWGVRLSVDAAAARSRARERAQSSTSSGRAGTRFLQRKREEQKALGRLSADAQEHADEVLELLRKYADDARTRPPVRGDAATRLVLDATFLVPNGKATAFQAAVRRTRARLGDEGYRVALTGPWPPYNFVGVEG